MEPGEPRGQAVDHETAAYLVSNSKVDMVT